MDSTLDHLLASSEDGPGVGMGMAEGSGEEIPTAAVYQNDIGNGKSTTKSALICAFSSFILIALVRKYLIFIYVYLDLVHVVM